MFIEDRFFFESGFGFYCENCEDKYMVFFLLCFIIFYWVIFIVFYYIVFYFILVLYGDLHVI